MLTFQSLILQFANFLNRLVPFIIALTLLVFLWSIFKLVLTSNEDARKEAIKLITFGVVALFVMVSVWGLVNILVSTLKLQNNVNIQQGPGVPRF